MAQLKDIRTRLAANGATCTGIKRAYAHVPAVVNATPALWVRPVRIGVGETFEAASSYLFAVRVAVQVGDWNDAQERLDDLLATNGAGSVIVALESDLDLNGEAHSVRVIDVDDYGIEEIGGTEFVGATVNVEVYA